MSHYILLDNQPIIEPDLLTWAMWLETAERTVAKDTIGDSEISTVFLGLDHAFGGGKPLLYETLVFGGALNQAMDRYSTLEEAQNGHEQMVLRVIDAQGEVI